MEKKLVLGVLGLLIVGLVLSVGVASAFNGEDAGKNIDPDKIAELKGQREEKRAEHQAVMETVRSAIEAGDYDAFVEAVDNMELTPKIAEVIKNEDDFNKLVEIQALREKIQELNKELGLPGQGLGNGMGPGRGFGKGQRMGNNPGQTGCPFAEE